MEPLQLLLGGSFIRRCLLKMRLNRERLDLFRLLRMLFALPCCMVLRLGIRILDSLLIVF